MAQTQTTTAPPEFPTQPGAAPGAASAAVEIPVEVLVPKTLEEVRSIRAQREELSDQLVSSQSRFRSWMRDLDNAPADARPEIQQHLKVLSDRIVQLEADIAYTGRQLTLTRPDLMQQTAAPPRSIFNLPPEDVLTVANVFSIFVLAPLAFAFARLIWKRSNFSGKSAAAEVDSTPRLRRVEQAVDAIAIEVERISEGQRFITNLMAGEQRKAVAAPVVDSSGDNLTRRTD